MINYILYINLINLTTKKNSLERSTGFSGKRRTARIASTGGDAKTSPHIAAVSIPSPTNPAWAGSWPLPPPVDTLTNS